jgi:carotenoid cleavage dioxygenase-like enzyme
MIHDWAITENYVIIPSLALENRPDLTIKEGGFIFKFDDTVPARYGIMKKFCQNVDQVQWFELPSHYVFHYVNAWEETNEKGEMIIKLFGCIQTKLSINFEEEHPFMDGQQSPKLTKFTFNLATGESTMVKLLDDIACEFPVINQNLVGYKTRYCYLSKFQKVLPKTINA